MIVAMCGPRFFLALIPPMGEWPQPSWAMPHFTMIAKMTAALSMKPVIHTICEKSGPSNSMVSPPLRISARDGQLSVGP
jgi:hypothetical protein